MVLKVWWEYRNQARIKKELDRLERELAYLNIFKNKYQDMKRINYLGRRITYLKRKLMDMEG